MSQLTPKKAAEVTYSKLADMTITDANMGWKKPLDHIPKLKKWVKEVIDKGELYSEPEVSLVEETIPDEDEEVDIIELEEGG